MTHKGTVRLETERLVLRRFERGDAPAMLKNWASDPEVTKFLTWMPHQSIMITENVISAWLAEYTKPEFYQWAIELKELGEPIGSISVVGLVEERDIVSIGYCIGSKWWHRGYTSEAFAAVIKFLFEEVGVNRLEARHNPNNPYSGEVMKKCGLKYEGTLRQAATDNTGIVDLCIYSMLRSEYFEGN